MPENKNILEILRERNRELVAEIEKHLTAEELNEKNDGKDLTIPYEDLTANLEGLKLLIINHDLK